MSVPLICPQGHPVSIADTTCPFCNTQLSTDAIPLPSASILPAVRGYEVLAKLGEGGMGVVYRARHVALKRIVALKMIRQRQGDGPSAEEQERFRSEAEAIARLHHPAIVQIFEVGEHLDQPYFAMEFVDGRNLSVRAHEFKDPRTAAALVEQLARAVHFAHQRRLVHLDLKPENVLITEQGEPKITDFGLARRMEGEEERNTGWVGGTPGYMAPEQCTGSDGEIGPAADVYGLGAILYRLVTGRIPVEISTLHERTVREWREFLAAAYGKPIPTMRTIRPELTANLDAIGRRCLEPEPS